MGGLKLLCSCADAKSLAVSRGHLRPAHLNNAPRCNPKLRRTHCLSPTLSFSCSFPSLSSHTAPKACFTLHNLIYSTQVFCQSLHSLALSSSHSFTFWASQMHYGCQTERYGSNCISSHLNHSIGSL